MKNKLGMQLSFYVCVKNKNAQRSGFAAQMQETSKEGAE